jgi:hypothetical protein
MSFQLDYFLPLSAMANSNVPRTYMYKTSSVTTDDSYGDTLAEIITDDYFLAQYQVLDAGDMIIVFPEASTVPIQVGVVSATSSTVTTEVIGGIIVLTAAITLDANDSGKTLVLNAAAGVAVTLPDAALGLKYKFLHGETTTTSVGHIISATDDDGDNIKGVVTINGALVATTGSDVITFTSTVALAGDWCTIESDGTNWYVAGQGSAATSIAFS